MWLSVPCRESKVENKKKERRKEDKKKKESEQQIESSDEDISEQGELLHLYTYLIFWNGERERDGLFSVILSQFRLDIYESSQLQ